jgi:hypothetical protein
MPKLRKSLPFPLTLPNELRRDHLQPYDKHRQSAKPEDGHEDQLLDAAAEHNYGQNITAADDYPAKEVFGANEAFFRKQDVSNIGRRDVLSEELPDKDRKTPAIRLKKKAKSYNIDILGGLVTPPAQSRMRIRSSNASHLDVTDENAQERQATVPKHDVRALAVLLALGLILLACAPQKTLKVALMLLMCFGEFPAWMPWWNILLAMVLPMGFKARLEVAMFLGMVAWIGKLEWAAAWGRVVKWAWE